MILLEALTILIIVGLRRLANFPSTNSGFQELPEVTIIVPIRNESHNLKRFINSLEQTDYPSDNIECIFIDDHSDDDSQAAFNLMTDVAIRIRFISLPGDTDNTIGRKPKALSLGVRNASSEIILTTDADCTPPKGWIFGMVQALTEDTSFVAGPVIEVERATIFSRIENLEFLSLVVSGAGLIGIGTPIICNGANLAFRRSSFLEAEGFGETHSSCSDETLMHRILHRHIGKVKFLADPSVLMLTASDPSFGTFIHRRVRWASKKERYENPWVLVELVLLYICTIIPLLSVPLILLHPPLFIPLLLFFGMKFIIDLIAMKTGANLFGVHFKMSDFLLAEILHTPYIFVTGLWGQFGTFRWKKRELDK